jgi:hypothetical protein
MLQQFSRDRGLPEVPSPLLHLQEAVATLSDIDAVVRTALT